MSDTTQAELANPTNATPDAGHPTDGSTAGPRTVGGYVIETGITPPEGIDTQRRRYPFGELKMGESVLITGVEKSTLSGALTSWRTRKNKVNMRMWPESGGFRVTRIG